VAYNVTQLFEEVKVDFIDVSATTKVFNKVTNKNCWGILISVCNIG
jgi:hypothetical protein